LRTPRACLSTYRARPTTVRIPVTYGRAYCSLQRSYLRRAARYRLLRTTASAPPPLPLPGSATTHKTHRYAQQRATTRAAGSLCRAAALCLRSCASTHLPTFRAIPPPPLHFRILSLPSPFSRYTALCRSGTHARPPLQLPASLSTSLPTTMAALRVRMARHALALPKADAAFVLRGEQRLPAC